MTCPICQHQMAAVYASHVLVCINCDETYDPFPPSASGHRDEDVKSPGQAVPPQGQPSNVHFGKRAR